MARRGSGVCCQISAAVGASQGAAIPGVGHHGRITRSPPGAVGAPKSQTSGPTTRTSGGSSERSSRSHALSRSPGRPVNGTGFPFTKPYGRAVTWVAISGGHAPANTTQYRESPRATTCRARRTTGHEREVPRPERSPRRDRPRTRARSRDRARRRRSARSPRAALRRSQCSRGARRTRRRRPRFTSTVAAWRLQ